MLTPDEARTLLDSIDTTSLPSLRDRALIALMVYTFARVGAAVAMKVEDYFVQGRSNAEKELVSQGLATTPGHIDSF